MYLQVEKPKVIRFRYLPKNLNFPLGAMRNALPFPLLVANNLC
jgi:hypothetical protein